MKYKKIEKKELKEKLEKHKLWLDTFGEEGVRLDLSYYDLREFNFKKAILALAKMSHSNLSGVDLSYADMRGIDLSYSNLSRANLSHSNLGSIHWPSSKPLV